MQLGFLLTGTSIISKDPNSDWLVVGVTRPAILARIGCT